MFPKNFYAIIAFFAIFMLFSCEEDTNDEYYGKIKGKVIHKTLNTPVAEVFITTDPPTEAVLTDDNGEFYFKRIQPGDYRIYAEKKGFFSNDVAVSVRSGHETKAYLQMIDFMSANEPPEKPQIVIPDNGSKIGGNQITFKWLCSDPDGDELSYDIYLDSKEDPVEKIVEELDTDYYKYSFLTDSTKYYWKVVARDELGATTESDIYSFTYVKAALNASLYEGLILYLPLDGNADDHSDNNLDPGEVDINYVADRNGIESSAAYFNGQSSIISVKDNPLIDLVRFSISAWIKPSEEWGKPDQNDIDLIGRWGEYGNSPASSFLLMIRTSGYVFGAVRYDTQKYKVLTSSEPVTSGVWSHVVTTFNGIELKIYINGILKGSVPSSSPLPTDAPLAIGRRYDYTCAFKGAIDEVYIHNRALDADEVMIMYED